jgi:hypothetical protein
LPDFFGKISSKAFSLSFIPFVGALEILGCCGANDKLHAFGLA